MNGRTRNRQVGLKQRRQAIRKLKFYRHPTCPYCYYEHTDSLNSTLAWNFDGDDADITCQGCGETFHCFIHYSNSDRPPSYVSYFISDLSKLRIGLEFIRDELTRLRDKPSRAREIALDHCERLLETEMFWD